MFKSLDWTKISDGITQLLGCLTDCPPEAADIIGKVATQYKQYANRYSKGARKVGSACSTASRLLHMYIDSESNYQGLVEVLPTILAPLSDAIKDFGDKLEGILDGIATTYGQLQQLKVILEAGKTRRRKILKIVLAVSACIVVGGIIGAVTCGAGCAGVAAVVVGKVALVNATTGVVAGTVAITKPVAACIAVTAAGGGAGLLAGGIFGGKKASKKCEADTDVRKMIEQNLEAINAARDKIDTLEKLVKSTQDDNAKVEAACNLAEALYGVRNNLVDDKLVNSARELMETCDNHMNVKNQLELNLE